MAEADLLERQIAAGIERLEALRGRAGKAPAEDGQIVQQLLAELASALAELAATAEELKQRNDDLVAAHQALVAANVEAEENFDWAPAAYLISDTAGKIRRINRAAIELLRFNPRFVDGKLLLPRLHADEQRKFVENVAAIARGGSLEWPSRVSIADEEIPISLHGVPVRDGSGEVVGIRWTVRDLSDQQRNAAEERRLHAMAALGEMAGTVAHQLRNPLAGLRGMLQLLRTRARESDRDALNEAVDAVARLDGTVRALLDFTRPWRSGSGGCNPREVADQVAAERNADLRERQIEVTATGPACRIQVDPAFLRQLFAELVDNAAESIMGAGRIHLEIERGKAAVIARVRDSGAGMSAETLRRAFEPFYTTRTRGTGLGLAICRRIVETNGGSIEASNNPAGGSVISVRFPAGG
jgi:PAS domain S-box-containing protein